MLLVLITGLPGTGKSTLAEAGRAGARGPGSRPRLGDERPAALPEVQEALDGMGVRGHRGVGWSLLWALARSQLRLGHLGRPRRRGPRSPRWTGTRRVAREEGAASLVVMTSCDDASLHRAAGRGPPAADPGLVRVGLGRRWRGPGRRGSHPATSISSSRRGDPEEENAERVRSLVLSAAR